MAENITHRLLQLQQAADILEISQAATNRNCDIFFLLLNSAFVFFMQCGFAFLECGAVRSKNTTNILTKNMIDVFVSGMAYWATGYAFAFGIGNAFIGYDYKYFFSGTEDIPRWFFQFVYATTACTIVSGAVAERCAFEAYLIYSFAITSFIYPVVTHWCWSQWGWLHKGIYYGDTNIAYADFAGSGVVHIVGGTCSFVGAAFLGPRIGRFHGKNVQHIHGHSVPLAALGGFILLLGFLYFNGGSQASITQPGDGEIVARATMNTLISGSSAAFTGLLVVKLFTNHKWSLLIPLNVALAGMVASCAGGNVYYPYAAFVVGVIACFFYFTVEFIVRKLQIDDPLDAISVHGGGGIWGVLAVKIFGFNGGVVYTGSKVALVGLAWNLIGALTIIAWCAAICTIVFAILRLFNLLRVSEEIELKGLDIPKHGEPAYPVKAYGHGWKEDSVGTILHSMENPGDSSENMNKKSDRDAPSFVSRRNVSSNLSYATKL